MARKSNLVIDQGSDFTVVFSTNTFAPSISDLTGYTAEAKMKLNYSSNTSATFNTSVNANLFNVTLSMNSITTSNITPNRYVFDCELTSPSNTKIRLVEGMITVTPSVT